MRPIWGYLNHTYVTAELVNTKLEAQFDYRALSTLLGLFFTLYVLGWICGCVTRSEVLFQMLDVDDGGSIGVGEYRKTLNMAGSQRRYRRGVVSHV